MPPRRKPRHMAAIKESDSSSNMMKNPNSGLSCCESSLSGKEQKTKKLQKNQIIAGDQIEEVLETIGLHGVSHSRDAQIRGLLEYLKDLKVGTYVMCCICKTWFFLSDQKDVLEIPDLITCSSDAMKRQTIQRLGKTWDPDPNDFQDLLYSCGSVVWAKQGKFVMWPGMIDFCPDNLTFTWNDQEENGVIRGPDWYNVVFFSGSIKSKATRCWIKTDNIKPFTSSSSDKFAEPKKPSDKEKYDQAIQEATKALKFPVQQRLNTFSFVSQFDGIFGSLPGKKRSKKSRRHWSKLRRNKHTSENDEPCHKKDDSYKPGERNYTDRDKPTHCASIDEENRDDIDEPILSINIRENSADSQASITNKRLDKNVKEHGLEIHADMTSLIDSQAIPVRDAILKSEEAESDFSCQELSIDLDRNGLESKRSSQIFPQAPVPPLLLSRSPVPMTDNLMCEMSQNLPLNIIQNAGNIDKHQSTEAVEPNTSEFVVIRSAISVKDFSKCDIDVQNINEPTSSSAISQNGSNPLEDNEDISSKILPYSNSIDKETGDSDTKCNSTINDPGAAQNIHEVTSSSITSQKGSNFLEDIEYISSEILPYLNSIDKENGNADIQFNSTMCNPTNSNWSCDDNQVKKLPFNELKDTFNSEPSIERLIPAANLNLNTITLTSSDKGNESTAHLKIFPKPPLTGNMLVMLAIQNEVYLIPHKVDMELLSRRSKISEFLQYHFPFFASSTAIKREYAKKIVSGVLKEVKNESQICIQPGELEEFYYPLRSACDEKYEDVLKSMRCPYMLEIFLMNCHPKPAFFRKPPFSYHALLDMAMYYLCKSQPKSSPNSEENQQWIEILDIILFVQTVFPFYSQKAGAFGRVSFDPNGNTFGEDIRTYINQNSTAAKSLASVSKKPDCRRARRITYEVLDGRLNLSPKPERMRELAKNLWKLQTLKHCIKEKTINHLISAFPELDDLIKENKNIKSPIDQRSIPNTKRKNASPVNETVEFDKISRLTHLTGSTGDTLKLNDEFTCVNLPLKRSKETRTSSTSSGSSTSSRPIALSLERSKLNDEKGYDYVNQIEASDLSYVDDQASIDQLEATLMDESFIELTHTII